MVGNLQVGIPDQQSLVRFFQLNRACSQHVRRSDDRILHIDGLADIQPELRYTLPRAKRIGRKGQRMERPRDAPAEYPCQQQPQNKQHGHACCQLV